MPETFQLEIVTPDRLVVKDTAEEAQIPGKQGYLGVLPGHAPLITELDVGEITYRRNGQTQRLAVAWGFAEVLPEKVTVLAETAERPEEINAAHAEQELRAAEEHLTSGHSEQEVSRALNQMRRAQVRLQVAQGK